jgi:hypothetical protein
MPRNEHFLPWKTETFFRNENPHVSALPKMQSFVLAKIAAMAKIAEVIDTNNAFSFINVFCVILKVHKIENFFGSDFEFCVISLLVMLKY